jgi:hypothetical protein
MPVKRSSQRFTRENSRSISSAALTVTALSCTIPEVHPWPRPTARERSDTDRFGLDAAVLIGVFLHLCVHNLQVLLQL